MQQCSSVLWYHSEFTVAGLRRIITESSIGREFNIESPECGKAELLRLAGLINE
jgi:hypothetical protein